MDQVFSSEKLELTVKMTTKCSYTSASTHSDKLATLTPCHAELVISGPVRLLIPAMQILWM